MLSPVAIVGAALILIALERRWPYTRGQRFLRAGLGVDLIGYALVQSYLLGLVITRIIGVARRRDRAVAAAPGQRLAGRGAGRVLRRHARSLHLLFHRLQHRSPLLWRIHEAHHATADVDWLSGARSHALEILINQTIEFAPIVLLGAAPEVALIKLTLDAIWGMYIHANIDVRSRAAAVDHQRPRDAPLAPRDRDPRRRELRHQVRVLGLAVRHRVPPGAASRRASASPSRSRAATSRSRSTRFCRGECDQR